MIAVYNERQDNETTWQSSFTTMLPEIQQRLRRAFRHLDAEAREDAVEEAVIHSLLSYARLHDQGRAEAASASSLCWYATLAVKRGRPACGRMNGKEVLGRYGQISNGFQVEHLSGGWIDSLVEDKRASIPDVVAAKMDVGAWFATLTQRMKQLAMDLALGCSTAEVARKHGVTPGRISQMRRTLEGSWNAFQQESLGVPAQC